MLDVILVNPHYVPLLNHLTGRIPCQSYFNPEETRLFLARCYEFLDFLIPVYLSSGKSPFHIAVGCTGGQHRSVAVVEWLSEYYSKKGVRCVVRHRDIERGQVGE